MGKKNKNVRTTIFSLALPALLILAWIFAFGGSVAPGGAPGDSSPANSVRWLLYFSGWNFVVSSVMHSVFAKKTAASIGWHTNGFQYELAAASLGLGIASFYAGRHGLEAWVTASIPIIAFLGLAGLNHIKEIIRDKNYAPNNTLILIWDFGMPLSLAVLLWPMIK